jgi:hypothetical protein
MTNPASLAGSGIAAQENIRPTILYYVNNQRALLDRLAAFSNTGAYRRLLDFANERCSGDPELWLAEWLIAPGFGFDDDRPIDAVREVGGTEQLLDRLGRLTWLNPRRD